MTEYKDKRPTWCEGDPHAKVVENKMAIMEHFAAIMKLSGISVDAPDTQRTPERFWEVINLATKGYNKQVTLHRVYDDDHLDGLPTMRISKGIKFTSFCEHHWMPFIGTCDIAYVPDGKVTGMSKLPQVVEKYAMRFQNQERMTEQIAQEIWDVVKPQGLMVITRAIHTCERVEGFVRDGPYICSAVRGVFTKDINPREEALKLLETSDNKV